MLAGVIFLFFADFLRLGLVLLLLCLLLAGGVFFGDLLLGNALFL